MTKIEQILLGKNISPALVGFTYIATAYDEWEKWNGNDVKVCVLYSIVAKKCKTTYQRVERGIRYALESAKINMTNKKFIAQLVLETK